MQTKSRKDAGEGAEPLCDWVIDRRGAVVLPLDWAIDSPKEGRHLVVIGPGEQRASRRGAAECLLRRDESSISSAAIRVLPLRGPFNAVKPTLATFLDDVGWFETHIHTHIRTYTPAHTNPVNSSYKLAGS